MPTWGSHPPRQQIDAASAAPHTFRGPHRDSCAIGTVDKMCYACGPQASQTYDGYVNSAYMRAARDSGLTPDECVIMARASLEACWALTDEQRAGNLEKLKAYCENWRPKAKAT